LCLLHFARLQLERKFVKNAENQNEWQWRTGWRKNRIYYYGVGRYFTLFGDIPYQTLGVSIYIYISYIIIYSVRETRRGEDTKKYVYTSQ